MLSLIVIRVTRSTPCMPLHCCVQTAKCEGIRWLQGLGLVRSDDRVGECGFYRLYRCPSRGMIQGTKVVGVEPVEEGVKVGNALVEIEFVSVLTVSVPDVHVAFRFQCPAQATRTLDTLTLPTRTHPFSLSFSLSLSLCVCVSIYLRLSGW